MIMEFSFGVIIGLCAQGLFFARTTLQWWQTEKLKKTANPYVYWLLSLIACLLFFLYGVYRQDFAIILSQAVVYGIYLWNFYSKGGTSKFPRVLKWLLISLFVAVPLYVLWYVIINWTMILTTLFHNEDLPPALLTFGVVANVTFMSRFLVQFVHSYRKGRSELPLGFFIVGAIGSSMILVYGIIRCDYVLLLQCFNLIVFARNIIIALNHKRSNQLR